MKDLLHFFFGHCYVWSCLEAKPHLKRLNLSKNNLNDGGFFFLLTLDLSLIQDVKIDKREIKESEDRAEESLLFTLNLNFTMLSYMFIYLAGIYK